MAVEFAEKLRITARALGCTTQKELCARFAALNPNTHFTPQKSYKWMSGRSLPRSGEVYRDWAHLLDLERSAQFLLECPLEVFSGLVSARHKFNPEAFDAPPQDASDTSALSLLLGSYACYSLAWSKAARGRLIRGSLSILLDDDGGLFARYREDTAGGSLTYSGRIRRTPRTLYMHLEDAENDQVLFFSFAAPLPPGLVLTGLLAGSAYHDLEARPTASRMLGVRDLQSNGRIELGNRYLDLSAAAINQDLEGLGYAPCTGQDIGAVCQDFLHELGAHDRIEISLSESESLAMAFARLQMT